MVQPVADQAAEVQPDAGGFLVPPAVVPGEALFKYPGLVLLPDADAVVGDDHRGAVAINADLTAGGRVFQGIGEDLLHHEQQPLLIGQNGLPCLLKIQGDLFENEHPGEFPHRLPQHTVQRVLPQHIVRGVAVQS